MVLQALLDIITLTNLRVYFIYKGWGITVKRILRKLHLIFIITPSALIRKQLGKVMKEILFHIYFY